MNVAIIGTGYVGLVTGACLAHAGHRVACVDSDPGRVAAVARGESPIFEAGLSELLKEGIAAGLLSATADLEGAVAAADVVLVCVGTPSEAGRIDLGAVRRASVRIGEALRGRTDRPVVVIKSTVVPGTTGGIVRTDLERASGLRAGRDFGLGMNPEFLSQGSAVADCLRPDRIVIGALDDETARVLTKLYEPFPAPRLVTDLINAELVKYAANALQACLISFSNQIAGLCERIPGADERVVMQGVHLDHNLRVEGQGAPLLDFLHGGIGFGGSCFPKDLLALRQFAHEIGAPCDMLDAIVATNRARPAQVLEMLRHELGELSGKTVAVLGLAFKPGTDDIRESTGIHLIQRLRQAGAVVRGHDPLPLARRHAQAALPGEATIASTPQDALAGADAAVIATAWPDYAAWPWGELAPLMRHPLILDGRGLFDRAPPPSRWRLRRVGVGPAADISPQP